MSLIRIGLTAPRNTSFLPGSKFDVFLSFRGEDTRTNFTDHLYTALVEKGIHTFRDDEELERGEKVSQNLLQAIEESGIFIVIFSENYANSKWCLNELVSIMERRERGRKVFVVFYHVDPSEVRRQSGKYGDAFADYENDANLEREQIQKWRDALKAAGQLGGYPIENQYESEIVKKITRETLCEIIGKHCDEGGLVAKNSQLEALKELISKPKDVLMVGIYGLDGVGKTAIARALYDEIACQFEGASFLENVREVSKKSGLYCLQKRLFCDILLGGENQETTFHSIDNWLKDKLRRKKVLIVLDDVNDMKQLQTLAGGHDWFGEGSRIIITTKNKHLLFQHRVDEFYEPKELDSREALQLFSYHANTKEDSLYDFYPLSKQVISYCNHHPLALQVVGSFLRAKSYLQWQIQLESLARESVRENLNILRVCYNGLNHQEKNIFLDVACFFKGEYKDFVTKMLDRHEQYFSATEGIKVLTDRCLIAVSEGKLWMQNIIQKLGWQIVRKARNPNRFWDHMDIQRLLRRTMGIYEVEGLSLDLSKLKDIHFPAEVFAKMFKLKMLKVFLGCDLVEGKENYYVNFSKDPRLPCYELRYLHWHGYQPELFPPFEANELLELNMPFSRLIYVDKIHFPKLTILDLSHSRHLENISNFSRMPNLERLVLEGCASLIEVDSSIKYLNNLSLMNLKDCKSLKSLPNSICKFKSLTTLIVAGCSRLQQLPDKLEELQSLVNLNAHGTSIRGFNAPPNLRILHLGHCKKLEGIPMLPSSIQQADAYNCFSMGTLSSNTQLEAFFLERIQDPKSEFSILIPGNRIPNYFTHKSARSSVLTMELPNSDWYNDDFLGFSVCIVLAPKAELSHPEILCELNNFTFFYSCGEDNIVDEFAESDQECCGNRGTYHVWLAFQPQARMDRCRPQEWNQITASFEVFACEVKECAIYLTYK